MTVRDRRRIEGAAESAKTSKGERYAEEEICSVVWFRQPEEINDSLNQHLAFGRRAASHARGRNGDREIYRQQDTMARLVRKQLSWLPSEMTHQNLHNEPKKSSNIVRLS